MCFPYADHCNALMTYRQLCFGSQPYHQISVHSTIIPSPIAGTAKATAKPHFELKFEYRPQHVQMDHAFWCGHVGVTLEYFFYYPSVYDLHWSHYYSEVIHIQNNLVF